MSFKKLLCLLFVALIVVLSACGSGKSSSSQQTTTTLSAIDNKNKELIDGYNRSLIDGTANKSDVNDAVGRVCWAVEEIDRFSQWLLVESFGNENKITGTNNYQPNDVRISGDFIDAVQKSFTRTTQILDPQKVRTDIRPFADAFLNRVKAAQTNLSQLTQSTSVVEAQEFLNKSYGQITALPAYAAFETAKKTSRACIELG